MPPAICSAMVVMPKKFRTNMPVTAKSNKTPQLTIAAFIAIRCFLHLGEPSESVTNIIDVLTGLTIAKSDVKLIANT